MQQRDRSLEIRVLNLIGEDGCFDLGDFFSRLEEAPDWGKILVAHIYLDHIVTEVLRASLLNADAYFQGHRPFSEKLNLCQALGCFADDFGKILAGINTARNRFAHKLVFEVSDEDKKNLFRLFTSSREVEDVILPGGFEQFLATVVVSAEATRVVFLRKADMNRERARLMEEAMVLLAARLGAR